MNRVTEAMGRTQYPYLSSDECTGLCTAKRAEKKSRIADETSDPGEDDEKTFKLLKGIGLVALFVALMVVLGSLVKGRRDDDGDDDEGDDAVTGPARRTLSQWTPAKVPVAPESGTQASVAHMTADGAPMDAQPNGLRGVWAGHRRLNDFPRHITVSLGQQLTEFVAEGIADAPRLDTSLATGCTEGLRVYWQCAERDNNREPSRWAESMSLAGDSMARGTFGQAAIAHARIAWELQSSGTGSNGIAYQLHTLCAAHLRFLEAERTQPHNAEVAAAHIKAAHALLTESQFILLPAAAQIHAATLTQLASVRLVAFGGRV
jgi:hypothetical protein